MTALTIQTLLAMAAVYFAGAGLACVLRRALFAASRTSSAERHVEPLPEAVQRAAGGAARFGAAPALAPRPAAPASRPAAPVAAAAAPAAAAGAQDLKRIRLIDAETEGALNRMGVTRYEQIAGWMQADVQRVTQSLGLKGRVNQENWIEQAQVLAKGGETHYAARRARGEAASAAPTADEGERRAPAAPSPPTHQVTMAPRPATGGAAGVAADIAPPVPPPVPAVVAAASPPRVEERAAFADRAPGPARVEPAAPVRPAPAPTHDNLQRIGGIDAATEQALAAHGVTRYLQIAAWTPADIERFDRELGGGGRIARENWLEQAQILSRGGDTAYSRESDRRAGVETIRPARLADAIRDNTAKADEGQRSDLGALRSQAFQSAEPGPESASRAGAHNKVLRSAALDDLKRIRGIGVLIEKKLNSMGIVAYEQIANWSAGDIDRVSQTLDFKGRIERENWVEQARILASGGATEFSRRVDRGDVDANRPKT